MRVSTEMEGGGAPRASGALQCEAKGCDKPGRRVQTRRGPLRACPGHEHALREAGELVDDLPLVRIELRPAAQVLRFPTTPKESVTMSKVSRGWTIQRKPAESITPDVCVCVGCNEPPKARGVCSLDLEALRQVNRLDDIANPAKGTPRGPKKKPAPARTKHAAGVLDATIGGTDTVGVTAAEAVELAREAEILAAAQAAAAVIAPNTAVAITVDVDPVEAPAAPSARDLEHMRACTELLTQVVETLGLTGIDYALLVQRVRDWVIGRELADEVPASAEAAERLGEPRLGRLLTRGERKDLHVQLTREMGYPISPDAVLAWGDGQCIDVIRWIEDGAPDHDRPAALTCAIADTAVTWWRGVDGQRDMLNLTAKACVAAEHEIREIAKVIDLQVTECAEEAGISLRDGQGRMVAFAGNDAPVWVRGGFVDMIALRRLKARQAIEAFVTARWSYGQLLGLESAIAGEDRDA